jgi:hypothetical protein
MQDFLTIILDPKTGVVAVLAFMWWKDRARADKLEAEKSALIERTLDALHTAAIAITAVTATVEEVKGLLSLSLSNLRRDNGK